MDELTKLDLILEWAKHHPEFHPAVFHSIKIQNRYRLTIKQKQAVNNVFYKWKIDKWDCENQPVPF